MSKEHDMHPKRTIEPIAPATIPGEPTDPKIPTERDPERNEDRGGLGKSEEEEQERRR